jgi:hypothetical protein
MSAAQTTVTKASGRMVPNTIAIVLSEPDGGEVSQY